MNRRQFGAAVLHALATYGLLDFLLARPVSADPLKPMLAGWVRDLEIMCRDLRQHPMSTEQWQTQVQSLLARVSVAELLARIDFNAVCRSLAYADYGVTTRDVRLPALEEAASGSFIKRLFAMRHGRTIIPHGHRNMVSMHIVLQGELHLRQYDRVRNEPGAVVIRPSVDETVGPGTASAISETRNNVHWLVARSARAYTLDFIVPGLVSQRGVVIENLDMHSAVAIDNGLLRVPILPVEVALRRYGKTVSPTSSPSTASYRDSTVRRQTMSP